MGNPVVHFEVVGKDGPALHRFYSELFDWKIDANNPQNYGMVDTGQEPAGGIGPGPDPNYPGHVTFYVRVDDVETTLKEAENRGGKKLMGPMSPAEGTTIALFADPEGHVIGLTQA
jgi:predicted enzyme related to lactoylglutathione lyase